MIDVVGERHVVQIDVVNNLRPLLGALLLLLSAYKVAMGTLFAKTDGELPSRPFKKTITVRSGMITAGASHANHGRALSCCHSTLRPGVMMG